MRFVRRLTWQVLLLTLALPAGAQVYTWTDDNGKVHYSDQRRVEDAQAQKIDIGAMPAPPPVEHLHPPSFSGTTLPLLLDTFYYADSVSGDTLDLITYYFGGDCVSPTSHNFNQLRTRYPGVLREEKKLQADMFRAFRTRAYGNLYRVGHYSAPQDNDLDSRYLTGRVEKLVINACRTSLRPGANTSDLQHTEVTQFNLVNVWLRVRWTLTRELGGEVVSEQVTEGIAATQLDSDLRLRSAVRQAFEVAADNLLSEESFREALVVSGGGADHSGRENYDLNPYQRAQRQTALAQALIELNPIKMAITEYYHIRESMPLSLDDVGFTSGSQSRRRYIESMQMQAPGVIHAVLPEDGVPGGHFIELIPEVERGYTRIYWRCVTSVPSHLRPTACEGK